MTGPDKPSESTPNPRPLQRLEEPTTKPMAFNGALAAAQLPDIAAPGALAAPPTLASLMLSLQRRWLLATFLSLVAAGVAVAVIAVLFPPKYAAQSRLELVSHPTRHIFTGAGDTDIDPSTYRANQPPIIKSPLVLSSALNSDKLKGLKIRDQSPDALEREMKVDFSQGPEIMTVKLYGTEPDELAPMLNAIIQAYKDEIEKRDNQNKGLLMTQLEKSLLDSEKALADKRAKLRQVEKDEDVPDPISLQILVNRLTLKVTGAEAMLRSVRNDLSKKQLDLTNMKSQLAAIDTDPVPETKLKIAVNNSGVMQTYALKISALDEQLTELEAFPPSVQRDSKIDGLEQKKGALEASAKVAEDGLRPKLEKLIRAEIQDGLDQEIRKTLGNIQALRIEETSYSKELEKVQAEFDALNPANRKGSVTVEKMRDDVKQILKTQETLAGQVALLKAEPAATSKIVVLQAAETPTEMDYSRFVKFASAGGMSAFGLVLFGVAYLEFLSRKVNGSAEVTQGLNVQLLGTIPQLPVRARRPIQGTLTQSELHWQGVLGESIDAIRTQLLHSARNDHIHVVMITSAIGGEGKTSLASQLAASLARGWRNTLLVDGDLRKPAIHNLFDMSLEPGLCEVLRGEASLEDSIKPTQLSRLSLLPAGHWDAHAIQALAQDGVRARFDQMKQQYDFIIVDSSPVLPIADSLLLGQRVDAVVFSVLRGVSRLPALQAAQQKLYALGVHVLGTVVIGSDGDAPNAAYTYSSQAN